MDLSLRRSAGRRAGGSGRLHMASTAAESWFLTRGLPSVLTRRARWRRLWPRSAPLLAAYATTEGCEFGVAFGAVVGFIEDGLPHLLGIAVFVALVLILTALGVGSVLGWAVRMTLSHLTAVGTMAVKALPLVMLTVLMFFNTYAWIMAAAISRRRLWLALLFLLTIAAAFVISATRERVRPMLQSTAVPPKDAQRLADTPFAAMPDVPDCAPLKSTERLNVVFVLAGLQIAQITVVAVVTTTIYLILGLIILTPALLNEWTHTYTSTATMLGFTLPVPDSLIHMTLFLGALTFMYISARAAGDAEYRSTFLDPLIDDLHTALIARNRYRGAVGGACDVDAAQRSD